MAIPTPDVIWADFNNDGSVKEPAKQDIRRWSRYVEALAKSVGMVTYVDKATMDADTTQDDGQAALIWADPVDANNFPTVWIWDDGANDWIVGTDRITELEAAIALANLHVAGNTAAADGIYAATGAMRPVAFADTTSYVLTWGTISNPTTRFTVTPSAAGFQVTGLAGLSSAVLPVGSKLPWDLVPGDSYYIEGVYTAGSSFAQLGFWFGTDPATTGDLSSSARMTVYRDTTLVPCLANGISSDVARTVSPAFGAAGAVALNVVFGFVIDVLADRSLRYRVYRNGLQQAVDVTVAPATAAGAVTVGMNIANGVTGDVKVWHKSSAGKNIWIDSTAASSGDGSRNSPLKTMLDVPAYMAKIGYQDEITINWLSDDDYGYLQCKDTVAGKWHLNGRPGGRTRLNGYIQETVVWDVVAGTSNTVWRTAQKWGAEARSQTNQPFVIGLPESPRPWYTFPNTILPLVTTANGGVDMAGLTTGGFAATGGFIYIRLPNGTGPDPNSLGGGLSIILSRTHYVIEMIGGPEVNMTNLQPQYSSQHIVIGGAGRGVIRNCNFHWSGYITNGFECHNGSFRFERVRVQYIGNDGIGRTSRTDIPYQAGVRQVIEIIDSEISHTKDDAAHTSGGDGISQHFNENNTNSCETRVVNTWVHDCWKCGIVCIDDLLMIDGCVVERCGTAQVSLFGVPTASAVGRTQRAFINGTVIDPQSLGTIGVQNVYIDGMALLRTDLMGCWIGTPAAGAGNGELVVTASALAGQTRDITKNVLAYRDCKTERVSGSVVKVGGGTEGTFLAVAANALV